MSSDDPQLTAAGLWQKEGKKATDSQDTETLQLLWWELAHTINFLKQNLQHRLSFSYYKSAGPWHPQCSLPLRAGLSPAPGQGSHGFPEPPGSRAKLGGERGA